MVENSIDREPHSGVFFLLSCKVKNDITANIFSNSQRIVNDFYGFIRKWIPKCFLNVDIIKNLTFSIGRCTSIDSFITHQCLKK